MPPVQAARLAKFLPQDRLENGALRSAGPGAAFAATVAGAFLCRRRCLDPLFPEISAIRRFGDRTDVIETSIGGELHMPEIALMGTAGGYIISAILAQ